MKTIRRSFFILLILLEVFSLPALADHLDVFGTGKTFPANFLFKENIPSLKNLEPNEFEPVLQKFMDARDQVESTTQSNLIQLGVSYIHLLQKDYKKAFEILNEEMNEEFILRDFSIYFLTVALRALAEERVQEEDYDQAIEYLKEAIQNQMILFKDFPSSPFHEDVPQILAQIETQLGDVYFKKEDYPAAWNSYNNALSREYPNHKKGHIKIYTSLARLYEAGQDLSEAADTHIFLLNNYPSSQITKAALTFLESNLKALEEINGNSRQLKELLNVREKENGSPTKSIARKLPEWPHVNNEIFDSLYHALSIGNFPKIVEYSTKVLEEFPGDEDTRGIFSHINKAILKNIQSDEWGEEVDRLVGLYPVRYMSKLASRLWDHGNPGAAQRVYQKILDKYPSEILACHKALYFMGRIEEDNRRYPEAIDYYKKLLNKYNWGRFTPSAQFKIPWLYRLEGQLEDAKKGFNDLLRYANPAKFRNLDNGLQEPDDFRPAALYWLADTERQLEDYDSRVESLKQLVEKYPMDFYAMVARIEMSHATSEFFGTPGYPKIHCSQMGIGRSQP